MPIIYGGEKRKIITFNLDKEEDRKLYDWVNQHPPFNSFMKRLIRSEMQRVTEQRGSMRIRSSTPDTPTIP